MNKVAVMFMIHDESKYLDLVSQAAQGVQNLKGEFDLFLFAYEKTPKEERDLIDSVIKRPYSLMITPMSIDNNIPLKHRWAYQQLVCAGYEYIMINQADDIPFEDRLIKQLKALQDHPDAGVCLSGYDIIINKEPKTSQTDYFRLCHCGFNVSYPSCWMFNTKIVPELPDLVGFERPLDYEWDPYILLKILQDVPIIGLNKTHEIYNIHTNNLSSQIPPIVYQTRFKELCNYYAFLVAEKRLKPYTVIEE